MISCEAFRSAIAIEDIDAVPPRDLARHAAACAACAAIAPEIATLGGGDTGDGVADHTPAIDAARPLPRVRIFFWRRAAAAALVVALIAVAGRLATAPARIHGDVRLSRAPRAATGIAIDPSHFRTVAASPAVTQSSFSDVIGGRVVRSQLTVTHWSSSPPVRP